MLASKLKKNYKYSWRVNHPCGLLLTAASATSLNLKQLAQQQERGQNHGKIFPLPPAGYCQAVQLHLVHMQWDRLVGAGHPRVSLQHFTVYAVAFTGIWASRRRLRTWRKIYDASNYIQKRNGEIPSVRHPTMEVGSSIPSPRARMYSQKWAFRQRLHLCWWWYFLSQDPRSCTLWISHRIPPWFLPLSSGQAFFFFHPARAQRQVSQRSSGATHLVHFHARVQTVLLF